MKAGSLWQAAQAIAGGAVGGAAPQARRAGAERIEHCDLPIQAPIAGGSIWRAKQRTAPYRTSNAAHRRASGSMQHPSCDVYLSRVTTGSAEPAERALAPPSRENTISMRGGGGGYSGRSKSSSTAC